MAIYKIDEVCEVIKGNTPIQKAICGEYPLVVTAEGRLTNEDYQFDCKAVCIPLVSSTGHGDASINRIHYQKGKFALGSILAAVIPKNKNILKAEYLHVYLSYMKDLILVPLMKGSANVSLTITALKSAEIEVPSLEEQENIIKLAKDMKEDREILNNALRMQLNDVVELRKSILQDAVKGKLVSQDNNDEPASVLLKKIEEEKEILIKEGKLKKQRQMQPIKKDEIPYELPKGWEWVRIGSLLSKIGAGSTPTGGRSVYLNSGIKFIRSQNVWNEGLRLESVAYISEIINGKMKGSIVEKEDILLNITGASIGRSCIVSNDFDVGNVNQHVSIIRLIDKSLKKYIHYCLISPYIQETIMNVQVGVSREGLSMAKLSNFVMPIPPLREQNRIVERVDQFMSLSDELEKNIEQSKKQSELLIQSVLQEAFKDKGEGNEEVSFGEFIKQKRKDKGMTVTEMLKLLKDIKSSEYTKIEEGLVKPDKLVIEKMARVLELSEVEMKSFEKLKIKANKDEESNFDCELKIAARRINKN